MTGSAKARDLKRVRLLLETGVDINAKDRHDQTVLLNAVPTSQVKRVRLLNERDADLKATLRRRAASGSCDMTTQPTDKE